MFCLRVRTLLRIFFILVIGSPVIQAQSPVAIEYTKPIPLRVQGNSFETHATDIHFLNMPVTGETQGNFIHSPDEVIVDGQTISVEDLMIVPGMEPTDENVAEMCSALVRLGGTTSVCSSD